MILEQLLGLLVFGGFMLMLGLGGYRKIAAGVSLLPVALLVLLLWITWGFPDAPSGLEIWAISATLILIVAGWIGFAIGGRIAHRRHIKNGMANS